MSDRQASSGGAAPPARDNSSLFSPSDQMPKPLSNFPQATWVTYRIYLTRWHQINDTFNSLVDSRKFLYGRIESVNLDGLCDALLERLAKTVSDAKEALLVDLGILDETFPALLNGSDYGPLSGV